MGKKLSHAMLDSQTGRPYRMCRKCGDTSPPHPMKFCTSYKRRLKNTKLAHDSTELSPVTAPATTSGDNEVPYEGSAEVDARGDMSLNMNMNSNANTGTLTTLGDQLSCASHTETSSMGTVQGSPAEDANTVPDRIPDSLIDPILRNLSATPTSPRAPPATPSRASSVTPLRLMSSTDELGSPAISTPTSSETTASSPVSTPSKPRRKRPTKADPCFGEVVGAYRGTKVMTIRRTRQPIEEKLKAKRLKNGQSDELDLGINIPKVFYDRTRSLVTQLHDLAEITGSWVHFSAQHPTASQPFIHYTSKRLRTNHELYQSLMTARRCDTTQLAAQLAKATGKLAQVEADAEARILEATAAKEAAEKATTELRAMIAAAGINIANVSTA
ncbi:hypothetical protein VNI00_017583 [Paramarasmius palmivorus]|uniref:Uncharacterized protein n=1 Tax=Paramarasmius palmivorus TaxID=297713 RepID=A0AAW0B4I6_9AGAR